MIRLFIALGVLLSSTSAAAVATLNRQPNGPYQVQFVHQTSSYITIEWKNGAELVQTRTCILSCNSVTPPPAGTYTDVGYILTLDGNREELVAELCTGTNLGVGRCANGDYTATLRPIVGDLSVRLQGIDGLQVNFAFASIRFWFGADKYWDRAGLGTTLPAGDYEAEFVSGTYLSHCNPVVSAARFPVTVLPTGESPETIITFNGTTCIWQFDNQSAQTVNITSDVGSCEAAPASVCTINVPWRAATTFSASAGTGYTAQFSHNFDPCAGTGPDRTTCREDKAERDWTNTAALDITVLNNATAPALVASVGSAPPADRVASKGDDRVVVAHMHVEPRNGTPQMNQLQVRVTGSSNPNADIKAVRVFDDTNNDGLVTTGEPQIATQVMAITGVSFITMNQTIAGPRNFVITVDIADELAAGVAVPFAPWSLLAIAIIPFVVLYRRRRVAVGAAAVLLVVGAIYACGSGGGGGQDGDDDQQQSDEDTTDDDVVDDDPTTDDDVGDNGGGDTAGGDSSGSDFDPPPGNVNFEFTVLGFTSGSGTIVEGIPVDGATISVAR